MLASFGSDNILKLSYKESPYVYSFRSGFYHFELWGADGGGSSPGCGAYVSGTLKLETRTKLYIYIGQKGVNGLNTAYNGGGRGQSGGSSGGGSTDVRLKGGSWNDFESLKSRIIVSGAGGGSQQSYWISKGGDAGILEGYKGSSISTGSCTVTLATGGKQNEFGIAGTGRLNGTDGDFGKGGDSSNDPNSDGGGSGYFGGGGGGTNHYIVGSGAGGSSFVSGLEGCKAILKSSTKENMKFSSLPFHYSGLIFTNITTKDGKEMNCNNGGDGKVEIRLLASLRDKHMSCKRQIKGNQNIIFIILLTYAS